MFSPKFQTENGKKRYQKLKNICRIFVIIYLIGVAVFSLSAGISEKNMNWTLLVLAFAALYTLPIAVAVVMVFHFFAHRICKKDGCLSHRDNRLNESFHILSLVFAVMTAAWLGFVYFLSRTEIKPFCDMTLSALASRMLIVFPCLSLGALVMNEIAQYFLSRLKNKEKGRKAVRITAIVLSAVILFVIFCVPYEVGVYTGGTKYYDAVLYSVVDWNRTSSPEYAKEEQKTRIYIFPFNLLSYDAKWYRKH